MGMSASQARYLSLTARKSDLEFRGQQINQSRLMLSNQSANLYSSMLSMSVPTPPVETDFMKDVYTFSLGGDSTTLSSYKLSMGKDGYGYDILYSKPATTNQLTASSVSGVQRAISRLAQSGVGSSQPIKIQIGYRDSDGAETFTSNQSPKVSRLITMKNSSCGGGLNNDFTSGNFQLGDNKNNIYTKQLYELLKKSTNYGATPKGIDIKKEKISGSSPNGQLIYNNNETLYQLNAEQLKNWFGGTNGGTKNSTDETYKTEGGLLEAIFGNKTLNLNKNEGTTTDGYGYQIFMDAKGDIYVFQSKKDVKASEISSSDGSTQTFTAGNVSEIKKYSLSEILRLRPDDSAVNSLNTNAPVYYTNLYSGNSADQSTDQVYFSGFSYDGTNLSFNYSLASQNNLGTIQTIDGHIVKNVSPEQLEQLDIVKTENQNENGETTDKNEDKPAITYNYYMDNETGNIWRQKITTTVKGEITQEWGLYTAQKKATIDNQEAQLLDEKDWPKGIELSTYTPNNYDCYYVPDGTGTGGYYYLVDKTNTTHYNSALDSDTNTATDTIGFTSSRSYSANNTYKIEGLTARVVSEKDIPSTILDAYSKDDYIVYATYNDKDTDFSNPVKYYIYPKDDDAAEAVCSYAYEKSYTGKNEILQGRANILVDENGRLAKIDILNQGTYALEYGQEKDEDAYNEAYREYEYKLEKYEKEMADIDARTAMIQQQDKKLELQLKSIDTEHSAIQTELEALKKVIDTNIKSSFGTFGG